MSPGFKPFTLFISYVQSFHLHQRLYNELPTDLFSCFAACHPKGDRGFDTGRLKFLLIFSF